MMMVMMGKPRLMSNYSSGQAQALSAPGGGEFEQRSKDKISARQQAIICDSSLSSGSGSNSCDVSGPAAQAAPLVMSTGGSGGGGGGGGSLQLSAAAQNKRKEKARIAARARRSQEASIIMEIASELEITQEKLRRIDKAAIVKLAIDYMKAFGVLCQCQRPEKFLALTQQPEPVVHHQPQQQQQQLRSLQAQQETPSPISSSSSSDNNSTSTSSDDIDIEKLINNNKLRQRQRHLELLQEIQQLEQQSQQSRQQQAEVRQRYQQQQHQQQPEPSLFSAPKLATASIFAPKTLDNMNSHFLMIEETDNGKSSFILKPDTEILDDDDLTHLAPQAGDISISLDVEPLDGIPSDDLLMLSPKSSVQAISSFFECKAA